MVHHYAPLFIVNATVDDPLVTLVKACRGTHCRGKVDSSGFESALGKCVLICACRRSGGGLWRRWCACSLRSAKVPAQLMVVSTGGHGFGIRQTANTASDCPPELAAWLKEWIQSRWHLWMSLSRIIRKPVPRCGNRRRARSLRPLLSGRRIRWLCWLLVPGIAAIVAAWHALQSLESGVFPQPRACLHALSAAPQSSPAVAGHKPHRSTVTTKTLIEIIVGITLLPLDAYSIHAGCTTTSLSASPQIRMEFRNPSPNP